ncbi:hypothetical protein L249_6564 [Ophiocordyceps polyrhachis-furcata BCC 54312]|uniref:EXPERA domain-containing protein n=1 Tax=Ophiocordyceps polyrhachis-furcata BCC 54312 TaxID=1330021 RepID=A0A367LLT1_9HYPO|nr:hypothetical protein L249_6564 [Ophiocordyceps polyrhachis-furcata BCC 54312]
MVNTRSASSRTASAQDSPPVTPPKSTRRPKRRSATAVQQRDGWAHVPSRATLFWMAVSLPLVAWDTIYVLGRPHTMEGGALHWPLWVPYKLYGEVDHIYGWKAFNARNGFTAAQGMLNLVESAMYLLYLGLFFRSPSRRLDGRPAAVAVLVGFSAAVMTLSKTMLYCKGSALPVGDVPLSLTRPGMNEYYSGFDNIGHNALLDLIFLWIIPNGAWLVGSSYMIWKLGGEILDGLETATTRVKQE